MLTRNELFPSRFFKADSVPRPIVATISFTKEELMDDNGKPKKKLVVYFEEHQTALALNGVNYNNIVEIAGTEDYDTWPGTQVEIYRDKTEVKGRQTPCVRVRAPTVRPAAAAPAPKRRDDPILTGRPPANEPPPHETVPPARDLDDDIDF